MDCDAFLARTGDLLGPLTGEQRERFRAMEELYVEWNSKINVISRKDMDEFYLHHVLHSLAIALYMRDELPQDYALALDGGLSFLDLGTGGGFPGIPLAVMFPRARFTLCDSVGKKVRVAADVASRLGLENVTAVNARAENLPESFDYVVCRAVASLDCLIPWVKGRFRRGILCLKGGEVAQETALAMARFRLKQGSVHTCRLDKWLNDSYFDGKYVIFTENFCK